MEKNLPKGWEYAELDSLFNLSYGKGLKTEELLEDGFDVYGANGIIGKFSRYTFEEPQVIISCRGAASGVIHKTNSKSFVTSNSIVLDRKSNEKLNLDFVKYAMTSIDKSEVITGTAQPQITIQLLKNLKLPFPPLPEQERIVAKLDSVFAHLEVAKQGLEKIPVLLKEFRQAVLSQAVTGKLTDGKVENWSTTKISEVVINIETGKSFRCLERPVKNGEVGIAKISAVTWGDFNEHETKTVLDESLINESLFIKRGDFLITRANTLELIGATLIVQEISNKIMLSDKIWRINFKQDILMDYINIFCKSNIGRRQIEEKSSGNQLSMRNLSQSNFLSIEFNQPPLNVQQEIVQRVKVLFSKADSIESQFKKLKEQIDQLPQAVLAKAFRGEV
jgi:type I restriction enzyme S subunit